MGGSRPAGRGRRLTCATQPDGGEAQRRTARRISAPVFAPTGDARISLEVGQSMSAPHALVTIVLGASYEAMWSVTRPTFEAYAQRFGLDLEVIRDVPAGSSPKYAKRQIHGLLDRYERVAFLDADILIRDDAPDLFAIVPEDQIGMFEEGRFFRSHLTAMRCFLEQLGSDDFDWPKAGKYYNSGVMVVSRRHAAAFASLHPEIYRFMGEQTFLNYLFWKFDYKVFELDHRLNRIGIVGRFTGEPRQDAFLIHYAGFPRGDIVELMRSDLEQWRQRPLRYPRRVCLNLDGRADYQIACEPLVRYCLERLSERDHFVITTAYPELFGHYHGRIDVRSASKPMSEKDCCVMRTAPARSFLVPGRSGVRRVPRGQWHPLDYGSLMTIQAQLVGEERRVTLPATPRIPGLERAVIVDCAGAGAAFPPAFWDAVVDDTAAAGLQPFVIGREATGACATERTWSGPQLLDILALCRCAAGIITADPTVAQVAGTTSARVGTMLSRAAGLLMPWQADYEELVEPSSKQRLVLSALSLRGTGGANSSVTERIPPTRSRVQQFLRSLARH